jgi:hypothetical protein
MLGHPVASTPGLPNPLPHSCCSPQYDIVCSAYNAASAMGHFRRIRAADGVSALPSIAAHFIAPQQTTRGAHREPPFQMQDYGCSLSVELPAGCADVPRVTGSVMPSAGEHPEIN